MILLFVACTQEETPVQRDVRRFQTALVDLETDVNRGFESGLPSMFQVGNTYIETIREWGDEQCPNLNAQFSSVDGHWVDDCVTVSGNRFFGFATFSELAVQEEDQFGNGGVFSSVWGSFDAIHNSGEIRTIGGLGQMALASRDGGFDMNLRGSFWLDDDNLWMREGSSSFEIHGSVYDQLELIGGVQYPSATVVFDNTVYDVEQCGGTSYGNVKLRDVSGYWFEWEKDACEDCAIVQWEGYNVGELCVGNALDSAIRALIEDSTEWIEGE